MVGRTRVRDIVTVESLVTQRINAILSRVMLGVRVRVVEEVFLLGEKEDVQFAVARTIGRMSALTWEHSGTRSLPRKVGAATLLEQMLGVTH